MLEIETVRERESRSMGVIVSVRAVSVCLIESGRERERAIVCLRGSWGE